MSCHRFFQKTKIALQIFTRVDDFGESHFSSLDGQTTFCLALPSLWEIQLRIPFSPRDGKKTAMT